MKQLEIIRETEKLLKKMDIPSQRKSINKNNAIWLFKNLQLRNSEHPNFKKAMENIKYILRNKLYMS